MADEKLRAGVSPAAVAVEERWRALERVLLAWPARAAVPCRASAITESGGPVAAAGAGTAHSVALDEELVTTDRAERPARRAGLADEGASGVVPAEGAVGPADTVAVSVLVPSSAAAAPVA
ncbi:MAG: hypothetical protein ACOYO2_04630 [Mycobacterium sp.]